MMGEKVCTTCGGSRLLAIHYFPYVTCEKSQVPHRMHQGGHHCGDPRRAEREEAR